MIRTLIPASILLPAAFAATEFAALEDAHIQSTLSTPPIAVLDEGSSQLFAGCAGAVGKDRCSVIPVRLPDFGPVDDPFESASFLFNYEGTQNGPIGNVDVYGLGRRAGPAVLVDDYWTATSTVDPTDATLIAQDVIPEGSTAYGLKSVGNATLVDYLNARYAGGAGAGEYVFFRLSVDVAQTGGASRYLITSADGGTAETKPRLIYNEGTSPVPTSERPFIWVRDSEKGGIQGKIANHSWARSLRDGIVGRVAGDVASHQNNRDAFLRGLPVRWDQNPPIYKTYPSFSEARNGSEDRFNAGLDCAVLFYLTGDEKYARCAADILHNAVRTILPVTPSTSAGNGGWIIQDNSYGLLYEARIMGSQLPIIYDFLHAWLLENRVYDVAAGGLVDFDFDDAQEVFRTYYELNRDHGQKDSNWSALMATSMLNCILALDDEVEREAALQVYLTTGSNRQASLSYDYRHFTEPGSVWPESLQYATSVGGIRAVHMVMIERYDPGLALFDAYPNFPLSLSRVRDLIYPNETEQISFGDGKRRREELPFFEYEMIYRHAKDRGYSELGSLMGSLINGGIAAGDYDRASLEAVGSLGPHYEQLQLLWQQPEITEAPAPHVLPRSDELPFAGITLQRNLSPNGDPDFGLMGFLGGAAHIHSHACGLAMELYGMGEVMGAKGGRGSSYTDTIHTKYYRLFAANNTIVVNGASMGDGGWKDLGIDTVDSVSMEPQPFADAVSANLSFLCSAFNDNRGNLAEATQQRTLALVRTSETSGFYVDLFRSASTVTNRMATTLNGTVTDQYHDYIYRNIGDLEMTIEADGANLPLHDQANRFQNDVGASWEQPGWRYFSNTKVSYPGQAEVFAQFKATPSGRSGLYMDMHMPSIATREVAKTDSPPIKYAPSPYDTRDSPTLVIRQIGEAWDEPFVSVFEPHFGASGGTILSTTALRRGDTVVGVRVESRVGGRDVVHHIISNPNDNQSYEDPARGLSFQGRFGIVADFGGGDFELYIGDGRSLAYQGTRITSLGGDTEASLVSRPGQEPLLTSNGAVELVVPEPAGDTALMAGWDDWNSNTSPDASVAAAGIVASATTSTASGNWSITDDGSSGRGSSGDRTWGSFDGKGHPASAVTTGAGSNLTAFNGVTDAELTFTLTNNGPTDWKLEGFHMDVIAFRPNAPRTYRLEVLSGDIATGLVHASAEDAINDLGGDLSGTNDQHDEVDLDLSGLLDRTLESGGTAVIRLAFSGGTGSGGGHHLFLDNIAFSGSTASLTELERWRHQHFGTLENAGTAADDFDANFDGESNFLEFATHQDPFAESRLLTPLTLGGGTVEFRYTRSKAAVADGVSFQVEWSDTLAVGDWSTEEVVDVADPEDPGNDQVEHRVVSLPVGSAGRRFVHLRVSAP